MKFNSPILQLLSPFGKWPHSKGLQIVDKLSARTIKKSFESSILNPFRRPIPIYIGHPDEDPVSFKNAKIVGKIRNIYPMKNGIAIAVEYQNHILKKILNGQLNALSPRWQMQVLKNGSFRPIKLISAGLTNNPNIPDSGKIIDFDINDASFKKNTISKLNYCIDEYHNCKNLLKQNSTKISELSDYIENDSIKKRLDNLNTDKPYSKKDLANLAIDRSKNLNEPYTKSFNIIRKQLCKKS